MQTAHEFRFVQEALPTLKRFYKLSLERGLTNLSALTVELS